MGKFDKEIKGFLEQFPEPYRTQALKNFDPDYCPERKPKSKADALISKLSKQLNKAHALSLAFSWHRSPQGYYYWGDFHTQLTKKHKNNPATQQVLLIRQKKIKKLSSRILL